VPKLAPARISRRTLLKGAGAGAAGVAAAPIGKPVAPAALAKPLGARIGPAANAPQTKLARVTVNGILYEVAIDTSWTLADLLRDQLALTGTKVACDRAECGSCTVVLDGKAVLACSMLAIEAADRTVLTVEGLSNGDELNKLQRAFYETGGVQCGFCTPGMLMTATALLAAKPKPTPDDVRLAISGNLCRCTGYTKIVDSIVRASQG
jgi:aerobic-type carbon monoxide dehydrogenase small subunit (CoxS/CutS family)